MARNILLFILFSSITESLAQSYLRILLALQAVKSHLSTSCSLRYPIKSNLFLLGKFAIITIFSALWNPVVLVWFCSLKKIQNRNAVWLNSSSPEHVPEDMLPMEIVPHLCVAALFKIVQEWKHTRCPLIGGWKLQKVVYTQWNFTQLQRKNKKLREMGGSGNYIKWGKPRIEDR